MIESTKNPRRLDYIDGLRAVACLSVLLFHAYAFAGSPEYRLSIGHHFPNPFRLIQFLTTGVNLFLILSGFCLFISFAKPGGDGKFKAALFAERRAWRILPAYYAAMILCLALFPVHDWLGRWTGLDFAPASEKPTHLSIVLHVFLQHGLYAPVNWQINGPFWTLGLEWQYYISFPLLVFLFHRWGAKVAVVSLLIVTLGYRAVFHHALESSPIALQWDVISSNLPGRLAEFGLGMLAAWQVCRRKEKRDANLRSGALFAIAIIFAVGGVKTAPFSVFNDLLWGLFYYMILMATLSGPSLLRSALSWRPLVWIGTISYSIYLIHLPILDLMRPFIVSATHPIRSFVILASVGGAICIGASFIFFFLFERPFLRGRPQWRRGTVSVDMPQSVPAADIAP